MYAVVCLRLSGMKVLVVNRDIIEIPKWLIHGNRRFTLYFTPCYQTCTMITEAGSLLTTPCYLTCSMITEAGSLLNTPCYLTCTR